MPDTPTNATHPDTPREAVRPAVRITLHEDWRNVRETLAIDNTSGGGLVARVRAVFAGCNDDGTTCAGCESLIASVLAALGVQP